MDFDNFSRFRQTGAPWAPYPNLGPENPPPPNSWEAAYTVTQQIAWLKATIDGMEYGEVTQEDLVKLKQYIDGIQRNLTAEIATKQDALTFDNAPTEGSTNPVTSGGVRAAIDSAIPENVYSKRETDALLALKQPKGDYVTTEQLEEKQDALTFDSTPTAGSLNPVTSEGIKAAIDAIEPAPVDAYTKTETDALLATKQPKGDYVTTEQLEEKQDALTFDSTPTAGSLNPVTSEGIKAAIDAIEPAPVDAYTKTETDALLATKQPKGDYVTGEQLATVNSTQTQHAQEIADNAAGIAGLDAGKQDKLTFDTEPTEGSLNPVTSDGIKKAIAAGGSGALDATPTADSTAGVQSGGVYSWSNPTPWAARDEIARTRPPTTKGLLDMLGLSRMATTRFIITEAIAVNGVEELSAHDELRIARPLFAFSGLTPEKLPWPDVSSAFVACNNTAESTIVNVGVTLTQADTLEIRVIPRRKAINLNMACPITRALITFQKYRNDGVIGMYKDAYLPTPFYDATTDVNGLKFTVNFAPDDPFDRINIVSIKYRYELSAPQV